MRQIVLNIKSISLPKDILAMFLDKAEECVLPPWIGMWNDIKEADLYVLSPTKFLLFLRYHGDRDEEAYLIQLDEFSVYYYPYDHSFLKPYLT